MTELLDDLENGEPSSDLSTMIAIGGLVSKFRHAVEPSSTF